MILHTATVAGRSVEWDVREVVRGGVGSDYVQFALDSEYKGCDRVVAVFASRGGGKPLRVICGDGEPFALPSALMAETGAVRTCVVGYVGDDVRVVSAMETAPLCVVEYGCAVDGDAPQDEAPDLWAQLMDEVRRANETAQSVRDDADAGKFKGEKGDKGDKGDRGEPGTSSVDKITNTEIEDICK